GEKVSWQGFGTSAAWDGACLKGSSQTNYFFVELAEGEHVIDFYADETPMLEKIEVFQLTDMLFEDFDLKPDPSVETRRNGIPWMSFIFLGARPKLFLIEAICWSASQKPESRDDDNIKIVVNGKILPNPQASTSKRYQNFFMSGNLSQGVSETLQLTSSSFEDFENTVELWYDEEPIITRLAIELDSIAQERDHSIMKNTPLKISIAENPDVRGGVPIYRDESYSEVSGNIHLIEKYAEQYGVDEDIIKSIIYLETTHGYADRVGELVHYLSGGWWGNTSLRPMNLQLRWGKIEENGKPLNYIREDLENPEKNIHVGTLLVKRIWDRLENPTVEKIGTVYNNSNALKVSEYGVWLGEIYREKLFD
ncbi:MAG: hypothetical protein U1C97_03035, partial [Candidatus Gracilibacteria bacterium]|nr:hypothetical protein [Candidatus Gracilibacteria bacterium]